MDDKVDIVNISLRRRYTSSYYSVISLFIEKAFELGVLTVASIGNEGDAPYIAGGASTSPNTLSVGATQSADLLTRALKMSPCSSREPAESNSLKPDIVASGGPFALAEASTGDRFKLIQGTSVSAPIVAGAAALVTEKCPE